MTLKLKKRLAAVSVMLLALFGILAVASPAQAVGSCTPSGTWTQASDWAQIRWCNVIDGSGAVYVGVQIQDIKTDGHGVHAETGFQVAPPNTGDPFWYSDNWQDNGSSCGSSGSVTTCHLTYAAGAYPSLRGLVRAVLGSPGSHYEYGWTWYSFN